MATVTNSLTVLSVATSATTPANAAAYKALTWSPVGSVTNIGDLGDTYNKIEAKVLGTRRVQKAKGSVDGGTFEVTCLRDSADAGQTALRTASKSDAPVFVKVELGDKPATGATPTGSLFYAPALVFGAPVTAGEADSFVEQKFSIETSARSSKSPRARPDAMKLAAEEITIRIDGERIALRPTLRVALRLERRHECLTSLVNKHQDGDLAAIADVLREHSSTWSDVPSFIESLAAPHGVFAGVDHLIPALIAHVYACAGVDLDTETDERASDARPHSRKSFAEHLEGLFKIATGPLGWTPDTAWNATPAEMLAAWDGLVDWHNALRGVKPKAEDTRSLDDKWRDLASRWRTRVEVA